MLGTLYHGALARTMLGVVALALIPWPAAAGDRTPPPRPSLRTALAEVRTRDLTPPRPSPAATPRSQQTTNPATQSASFFKTRTGVIVAVVTAVGAGYAIYSAQHDRIHSAGKK